MTRSTLSSRAISLVRQQGISRARDLTACGIPPVIVARLVRDGQLSRLSRGLYTLPSCVLSERHQMAEVSSRSPGAVFCLLTALSFHGITTQNPSELWIALANKSRPPRLQYPPLRTVRFSGPALALGIEMHTIDGVKVPVYSVAKTVVDCFKFRNKIGLDVALEALKDAWRKKKVSMDDLWESAQLCRMTNVMRPYLECLE